MKPLKYLSEKRRLSINIKDVDLGDIYYIVNKGHGQKLIKGVVIEINDIHQTVLLGGNAPFGSGNCGAHVGELYETKAEALKSMGGK